MERQINIQDEMVPYQIKQDAKGLIKDGALYKIDKENGQTIFYFSDGEMVTETKTDVLDCTCDSHLYGVRVCQHMYATYLKKAELLHEKKKLSLKERILEQESVTLLSLFQESLAEQFDVPVVTAKTHLRVDYLLALKYENEQRQLIIELKVGQARTYVVKNIQAFLDAVRHNQLLAFTKNFTFDPNEHTFSKEDDAILQMLAQISDIQKMYDLSDAYFTRSYQDDKTLIITPYLAEELLEKLALKKASLQIFSEQNEVLMRYPTIQIAKNALDFHYIFRSTSSGKYQIELESLQQAVFLDKYQLVFLDGTFHFLNDSKWLSIMPLVEFQKVTKSDVVQFNEARLSEMVSYVLPALQKSGTVDLDTSIQNRIINFPLKAQLFISIAEDGKHALKLQYAYADWIFEPFHFEENEGSDERIVIRDIETETKIMQLIENAPILFSGDHMVLSMKEQDLYHFYARIVPKLSEYVTIFMEDGMENMTFPDAEPVTTFDVADGSTFLSVSFEFLGIPEDETRDVLLSLREKKTYHRLKNGQFLSLEDESFEQIKRLFDVLDVRQNEVSETMQMPVYRGIQLYELENGQKDRQKFSKKYRELLEELHHFSEDHFTIPSMLNATLRDYQIVGFEWMKSLAKYQLGGVLADDMGLGKTIQTIAFLLSELEENKTLDPVLIVTPASLLYNWLNEFNTFGENVSVEIVEGSKSARLEKLANLEANHVYLISYQTLRQDVELLQENLFHTIILDESQMIKNYTTKVSQAVRSLKRKSMFALSGTPLENSVDELWTIFQTILPGFFPSLRKFKEVDHPKIVLLIRPFLLRRLKKDVARELPEKIETTLYSELTDEQKKIYLAYVEKIQAELSAGSYSQGEEQIRLLAGLTRLRQICCDPRLFIPDYSGESSKLIQLFDTVTAALDSGKRILIFSQFTSMLQLLKEGFSEREIPYFYLDGKTQARKRVEDVTAFNEGKKNIFLISLKAGGTGLNLTGADTVILFDLWWNPAIEEQAASRAHRIGQKNIVQVIRFIAKGTIEERIFELQQKKQALVDALIQPGEQLLNKLTTEEMKALLTFNKEGMR